MNTLPNEILLTIFSFIQLTQRILLRAVCRRWSLLLYDYSLLQHISLRKVRCKDFHMSSLFTAAKKLVLVDLQNSRSLDGSCVLHAGLSRLRQLTLTGTSVTDAFLSKILEASSGLQTLHLAGTRISSKCLPQIIGLKKLRYISVPPEDAHGFGRGAAITIVENCMALETFDCQEGYFFSAIEIYRIIDCNPNLTSLLIPYSFVDDISLVFIVGNLHKLSHLCVCETNVTQGCVQRMRAWKPHLEICWDVNHTP